jgi:hypothetical protein
MGSVLRLVGPYVWGRPIPSLYIRTPIIGINWAANSPNLTWYQPNLMLTFPSPGCRYSLPLLDLRRTSRWCSRREAVVVEPLPAAPLPVPRWVPSLAPLRVSSSVVLGHAPLFFKPTSPPIRVVSSATLSHYPSSHVFTLHLASPLPVVS